MAGILDDMPLSPAWYMEDSSLLSIESSFVLLNNISEW